MSDWNEDKIKQLVESNKVIVFGKGTRMEPMCGFTARAMAILEQSGKPFEVVNIFEHEDIRPALVSYSKWPTTPQVFVNGELLGGSDIVEQMQQNGELTKKLEVAFSEA